MSVNKSFKSNLSIRVRIVIKYLFILNSDYKEELTLIFKNRIETALKVNTTYSIKRKIDSYIFTYLFI